MNAMNKNNFQPEDGWWIRARKKSLPDSKGRWFAACIMKSWAITFISLLLMMGSPALLGEEKEVMAGDPILLAPTMAVTSDQAYYQWFRNGLPIANEHASTLYIDRVNRITHTGRYQLTAYLDEKTYDSEVIVLTVIDHDNDQDGMWIEEENRHGTDPNKRDTDNDGLDDAYEVGDPRFNPLNPDSDGDGVVDGVERLFSDPSLPSLSEFIQIDSSQSQFFIGKSAVLRAQFRETEGQPLFQWLKNGQLVHTADQPLYSIEALSVSDSGSYQVAAIADNAVYLSEAFELKVVPLEFSLEGFVGDTIVLTSNLLPPGDSSDIRWIKNGLDGGGYEMIASQTMDLTLRDLKLSDAGYYYLIIQPMLGWPQTSAPIRLTISDPDLDGDGLTRSFELQYGTDPNLADTDGDGLSDGDEVREYQTNPLLADTDADGYSDAEEIAAGTDPLIPNPRTPGPNPGPVFNITVEKYVGEDFVLSSGYPETPTTTFLWFKDRQWLPDERNLRLVRHRLTMEDNGMYHVIVMQDGKSITSAPVQLIVLDPDEDEDGLSYSLERLLGTDHLKWDSDGDGLSDGQEYQLTKTNPLASDSDGDGVPDNVEIAQRSDPNDPGDKPSAGGKPVILYEPFKITIQFPTEIGRQYQIYHSKDLMRWEAVTGILPGSGVVNEFNDEGAEVMGFWKVITVP